MPCYDYAPNIPKSAYLEADIKALQKQVAFLEAALCQTLEALEKQDADFYNLIDYKEAGIDKKKLVSWHKQHKEKDAIRRENEAKKKAKEAEKARVEQIKQEALEKLSDVEKKALGLNEYR